MTNPAQDRFLTKFSFDYKIDYSIATLIFTTRPMKISNVYNKKKMEPYMTYMVLIENKLH